jgi:hypothetical protein
MFDRCAAVYSIYVHRPLEKTAIAAPLTWLVVFRLEHKAVPLLQRLQHLAVNLFGTQQLRE